jgi:GH24 family phage-related lysozyme (muramidase)
MATPRNDGGTNAEGGMMPNMNLSTNGAAFVRYEEGFVGKYYLDPVKVGTIGIGFTWASKAFRDWWAANKPGVKFGPGATMNRAEAEAALIVVFAEEYGKAVNDFLGASVAQNVFDGMASTTYNCGAGALEWKWAAAAKDGDYARCATLLRTTATTAKGVKLAGLVRRRAEEAALIERGVYAGVTAAAVPSDAMSDGMLVRGERGPMVAALIKNLAALGYYDGALDDVFGYGTEAAVIAFQKSRGLEPDGYAGPATLKAIAAAIAKRGVPVPPATPPAANDNNPNWLVALIAALVGIFRKAA